MLLYVLLYVVLLLSLTDAVGVLLAVREGVGVMEMGTANTPMNWFPAGACASTVYPLPALFDESWLVSYRYSQLVTTADEEK